MAPTVFPLFPELVPELRNRIWEFAIVSSIQDIAVQLPRWFYSSWAERRRRAIVASLSGENKTTLLYVHIRDPYNGLKLRFEEDEFETLVDCLPISAVCRETRMIVAEFCQSLVPRMQFKYDTSHLWSLERPKQGAAPIVLRSVHSNPRAETLEHVFSQPTALAVNAGHFKSAEHLVGMIFRFFGSRIRRLVMDLKTGSGNPIKRAYWPGLGVAPISIEAILNHDSRVGPAIIDVTKDQEPKISASFWQNMLKSEVTLDHDFEGDPAIIYITRDRKLYVPERFWQNGIHKKDTTIHLLKLYEVFHASLERLPHLEYIEMNLEIQGMDVERTRLVTHWKRDYIADITTLQP